MILLHIKNTIAFDAYEKMRPNEDGELPKMARSVHWRGSSPVHKGNESLRILADTRDIPEDIIPGLIDIYTMEETFGVAAVYDTEGDLISEEIQPLTKARQAYDKVYPRTPIEVIPEEGDPYMQTSPLMFGGMAGHKTWHLLS